MKTNLHFYMISLITGLSSVAAADTRVILVDAEDFGKTAQNYLIETTVPGDFKTLEGIVWALLALGDQGANPKLSAPFIPKVVQPGARSPGGAAAVAVKPEMQKPLAHFFRGARKEGKVVTLSFSAGALPRLNGAVGVQATTKGPLEATVRLHFPDAETIRYEIDGKIFEDWDA